MYTAGNVVVAVVICIRDNPASALCRLKNEIYHGRRRRHHPENRIPQLMTSDLLKLDGWAGRTDSMVDGFYTYIIFCIYIYLGIILLCIHARAYIILLRV